VARVDQLFQDDPLIDEYAILPHVTTSLFDGAGSVDDGDEGVVAVSHKLGLSMEAALMLCRHGMQTLHQQGREAQRKGSELDAASRGLVLSLADCALAWDCRKALLQNNELDHQRELDFSAMVLRTNHKSGEAWAYRRHVLSSMLTALRSEECQKVVEVELELVEELAKKYDHHYYAWNHWAWLVQHTSQEHLVGSGSPQAADRFPRLAASTPSHYGIYHHRLQLLKKRIQQAMNLAEGPWLVGRKEEVNCSQETAESVRILGLVFREPALMHLAEEMRTSTHLLQTYSHLEAPWLFRSQLIVLVLGTVQERLCTDLDGVGQVECVEHLMELWLAEVSEANRNRRETSAGEAASAARLSHRMQVSLLQEMVAFVLSWASSAVQLDRVQQVMAMAVAEGSVALDKLVSTGSISSALQSCIRH